MCFALFDLFENYQFISYKCYYFVCVGVDKMLYLTWALSAYLRTHVITAIRLRLAAQQPHLSVKKQ